MSKIQEFRPTAKAQILLVFSSLLGSNTDCAKYLYQIYRECAEEDARDYRTKEIHQYFALSLRMMDTLETHQRHIPINRNLTEWLIKISKVGPTRGEIGYHHHQEIDYIGRQILDRKDTLDKIELIGTCRCLLRHVARSEGRPSDLDPLISIACR